MSYNFQAQSAQKQDHSMGSLLFSAFLGGSDVLSSVDMAYDTIEAIGEIRSERFQAAAKRQGNMSLTTQKAIGGVFQNSAEGIELQDTKPQSRYLNYDFGYQRKRGPSLGMAA